MYRNMLNSGKEHLQRGKKKVLEGRQYQVLCTVTLRQTIHIHNNECLIEI